jgi:hypothetical protein
VELILKFNAPNLTASEFDLVLNVEATVFLANNVNVFKQVFFI